MPKVVHFEIPVDDPDRASAFYRDALGWEVAGQEGVPYWLVLAGANDEPGANGALIARGELHQHPILTAGVQDIDDALSRIPQGGGQVVQGKLPIQGSVGPRTSGTRRATRSGSSNRRTKRPSARCWVNDRAEDGADHGRRNPRPAPRSARRGD